MTTSRNASQCSPQPLPNKFVHHAGYVVHALARQKAVQRGVVRDGFLCHGRTQPLCSLSPTSASRKVQSSYSIRQSTASNCGCVNTRLPNLVRCAGNTFRLTSSVSRANRTSPTLAIQVSRRRQNSLSLTPFLPPSAQTYRGCLQSHRDSIRAAGMAFRGRCGRREKGTRGRGIPSGQAGG